MVPGGFTSTATEIQQEGLRLPPVKLVRRGEIVQDIVDIILNNIRVPEERIGDIRAQIGALERSARGGSPRCSTATAPRRSRRRSAS